MTILVCGEALVDLFVQTSDEGELRTFATLGGSPFNVAVALARMGTSAAFFGGLSQDVFGDELRRALKRAGVDTRFAVTSSALSTISVVSLDAQGVPSYALHGEGKADRQIVPDDLPDLGPEVEAITLGSYTISVEPVAQAHLQLAQREFGHRVISLDPNLRQSATPDIDRWRSAFDRFIPFVSIVKASAEDVMFAYGPKTDHAELARSWMAAGVSLVVVTLGREGAVAYKAGLPPVWISGRPVDLVDTVGAGDVFHAALLTRLSQQNRLSRSNFATVTGAEIGDALRYAVAASTITCGRRGANPPTAAEIEAELVSR